ncbi:Tfp pilus assembly protein PilE [Cytobacillus eiseniae]|uniref:Tfp pilus assembly protein PilE n=1 Tax=Cytobacillus eiseniae TaxID=762947 RepID=A0ABS4RE27_9BACI|nr:hypothetical protein [Cytobacillus eiseniae]MBP2240600.1 Tfp pilus assembly protein PilE [Cytobacillus eiseniae]
MKIFDERGITLYELLATLVISMIVLPVIYGVFSSGVKLYNKIQVEGQLRDDADYTATMIMNTFYSFPFDYVKECGDSKANCIELVDQTKTAINQVEGKNFYNINQKEELGEEVIIRLELDEVEKNGKSQNAFLIDGKPIDVTSDLNNSELSLSCSECEEGMISLKLILDDQRLKKPLELKSQFGF